MNHLWRYFPCVLLSALVILLLAVKVNAAELKKFRLGLLDRWTGGNRVMDGQGDWRLRELWHRCRSDFYLLGPVVVQALISGDLQGGFAASMR
jgi:hypothetical protein